MSTRAISIALRAYRRDATRKLHVHGTLGQCTDTPTLPRVGDWAQASRCFEASDVAAFSGVTRDFNIIHSQASGQFKEAIVPGLFLASLIPAVFASALPGAVYRSQELAFSRAVAVGSEVDCRVEVTRVRLMKGGVRGAVVVCDTHLTQRGNEAAAVAGVASVFIPGAA